MDFESPEAAAVSQAERLAREEALRKAGQEGRVDVRGADSGMRESAEDDKAVKAEGTLAEKRRLNQEYAMSLEKLNNQIEELKAKIEKGDPKLKTAHENVLISLQGQKEELLKGFDKAVGQGTELKM